MNLKWNILLIKLDVLLVYKLEKLKHNFLFLYE